MKLKLCKFQKCRGLTIPLWGNWQLEAWYAPARETVELHTHETIDSHILCLWGHMAWVVAPRDVYRYRHTFGPFRTTSKAGRYKLAYANIPAGIQHGFQALSRS